MSYTFSMDSLAIIVLGFVQGVTEFLPISSDGHLAVTEALLHRAAGVRLPDLLGLNIVLHAGTLLAILVVYGRSLWALFGRDRKVLGLLAVGTLPAVVIGLPLHEWASDWLVNPLLAGCMLPLTGLLLLAPLKFSAGSLRHQEISWRQALWIGACQAVAILPGISRSGCTIVAGLSVGLRREAAATFSFLLAVPAVGGACVLELKDLLLADTTPAWGLLALGAAVSFVVGLVSLWWLLKWLNQGRLHYFAWWCVPLGLAVAAWQFAVR